jgi:hypothetical protein
MCYSLPILKHLTKNAVYVLSYCKMQSMCCHIVCITFSHRHLMVTLSLIQRISILVLGKNGLSQYLTYTLLTKHGRYKDITLVHLYL